METKMSFGKRVILIIVLTAIVMITVYLLKH
jgi:hypothetical protein